MSKNWEDEFDFQDDKTNNKNKKSNDKKNKKSALFSNQFQGFDVEEKNIKFPVISSKVANSVDKSAKNLNKVNLQEISSKKHEKKRTLQMDQLKEIYEESLVPLTSPLKHSQKQEGQQKIKASTSTLKEKRGQQNLNEYADEGFQQAEYQEDFQTHQEKKASPAAIKAKQGKEELMKKQAIVNLPKQIQKNRKGAQSMMKNSQSSARVYTRNSARSHDRSFNSRTRIDQKKQEPPNKYTNFAEKNCPNYQRGVLQEFNMDRIVRQNQKVRNTIKKFNDQLNEMINKNILMLKSKKEDKVVRQDQIIKQLQQLKVSNQTVLQTTLRDLSKLKDKESNLKQQQNHLTFDQRIQETKSSIAQISKTITKLNFEISNEGNKLSKIDKDSKQKQPNTDISSVKLHLINIKKDEEKYEETNKKLEAKLEDLTKKTAEIQAKFNEQVQGAKLKGINIVKNPQLLKKLQGLKKKVDIGKHHKGKTEALFKTKSDMVAYQLQQIKIQIKNLQNNTINCRNGCEQIQEESRKVVQKAKKGGKIPANLINSLQSIINEMERGVSSSKESSEEHSTFTQPKGAKKYQSLKNVEKIAAVSVTQRQPQRVEKAQDDSNINRPLLFKKKKQEEQKLEQRVWKDEKASSPLKVQKNRESAAQLAKFQDKQPEHKDQQKKKPFAFKKNKEKTEEQAKIESPKPEAFKEVGRKEEIRLQQPKKDEEITNIAPRMMRLKKNKQQPPKQDIKIAPINDINTQHNLSKENITNPLKGQQKGQENAVIVPKRFNLRIKDRKSEELGYVATNLQKKEEMKIEESKKIGLSIQKEQNQIKQVQKIAVSKADISQQKPYFNLKLKDRQKQANRQQTKIQVKVELPKEQIQSALKIPITLSDNPNPMKENNNPYAPQQGAKRQRQGPIRKAKPQQNAPKQQFSIFEQAGELQI